MTKKPPMKGKKPPFTQAQDDAYDKAHGIKENSPADKKMDAKLMGKGRKKAK